MVGMGLMDHLCGWRARKGTGVKREGRSLPGCMQGQERPPILRFTTNSRLILARTRATLGFEFLLGGCPRQPRITFSRSNTQRLYNPNLSFLANSRPSPESQHAQLVDTWSAAFEGQSSKACCLLCL